MSNKNKVNLVPLKLKNKVYAYIILTGLGRKNFYSSLVPSAFGCKHSTGHQYLSQFASTPSQVHLFSPGGRTWGSSGRGWRPALSGWLVGRCPTYCTSHCGGALRWWGFFPSIPLPPPRSQLFWQPPSFWRVQWNLPSSPSFQASRLQRGSQFSTTWLSTPKIFNLLQCFIQIWRSADRS